MLYAGYAEGEPSIVRFMQIRDFALASLKNDSGLEALREGGLPKTATFKRFATENTIAVAVTYTPPVKKRIVKPAPPPPTMITSKTCVWVIFLLHKRSGHTHAADNGDRANESNHKPEGK